MKIIHLKDISATDLSDPNNLFYLPLEVVLSKPSEELPIFPTVRCYKLPRDKYPQKEVNNEDKFGMWESWCDQYLLEVWKDYGDDGHVEHIFSQKFVLLYEDELPKSFGEYLAILNTI